MSRQRVLERVGWRFWRCFASSFYRDPNGVLNDLIEMLTQMGIQPIGKMKRPIRSAGSLNTKQLSPRAYKARPQVQVVGIDLGGINLEEAQEPASVTTGIGLGDKVIQVFADSQKRISVRVSAGANDLEKGRLPATSRSAP